MKRTNKPNVIIFTHGTFLDIQGQVCARTKICSKKGIGHSYVTLSLGLIYLVDHRSGRVLGHLLIVWFRNRSINPVKDYHWTRDCLALLISSIFFFFCRNIGWAEPRKEASSFTIEEAYLEKAREAGKHQGCLLRKPPQPSGEMTGRSVPSYYLFDMSFKKRACKIIYVEFISNELIKIRFHLNILFLQSKFFPNVFLRKDIRRAIIKNDFPFSRSWRTNRQNWKRLWKHLPNKQPIRYNLWKSDHVRYTVPRRNSFKKFKRWRKSSRRSVMILKTGSR